ncbi:similar to DNA mismatch repair protein (Mlh3) [Plenodomus lingam JN3]|uniref:Similar to DNA mismatch repair protein (Mlh3) n=1 Tax=Leptosphaeria maculans (strain JN3 / isolate v23.1.3 / race Av1-4-5-6-7-8) TaxID=985895 RepID=E5R510_LEPMJ|nr:similar to DNA mismatch repair protein (Mlh3) [Plenodomus lingam JN3]CBX92283.1 similar to DNA mismatch repair protein (Mlh3) [Plenodomus lingam JN3]
MTRSHSVQLASEKEKENGNGKYTVAETDTHSARCILPLPDDVAAQVKSSTAIVSVSHVVLELLKNALDAKATRIEAAVDFARGGCTVEDDGVGIPPIEFRHQGGLDTSKYAAQEAQLGRNGTFLASLAAMSLLTITSHHKEYLSHNSITFHHSKPVERQLPAPANKQVHSKHGTRVTVRNLFGNLPVRVKQRSAALDQKAEQDRLWDALKRDIVALFLSWQGSVSVKIRNGDGRAIINLNTSNSPKPTGDKCDHNSRQPPVRLTPMLNVLTQADCIAVDEWPSWIPVSASTSALSVKGAISLVPAPSKHVQFLSLGIQPILAEHGNNEVFHEINRLFSLSSFGVNQDDGEMDELEKTRRRTDQRFKSDGYTNRQLQSRKGVDRHPMFHLRITMKQVSPDSAADQLGDESTLQDVLEVLEAMITHWLSAHHFCPQQRRKKRGRSDTTSSTLDSSRENGTPTTGPLSVLLQPRIDRSHTSSKSRKKTQSKRPRSHVISDKTDSQVFADWSRIKSGNSDFHKKVPQLARLKTPSASSKLAAGPETPQSSFTAAQRFANLDVEHVQQGALSMQGAHSASENTTSEVQTLQNAKDDTILWTDPVTKKTCLLNARTGCVVSDLPSQPNTTPASKDLVLSQKTMNKSLRLPQRPPTAAIAETAWLTNILQNWENPVFNVSERRIQQVDLHEPGLEHSGYSHSRHRCSRIDIDKAFSQVAADTKSGKLSRYGLQHAQVISQVDKKFILVKMKSSPAAVAPNTQATELLVLIDQHAADERIQVEDLLRGLCTPANNQTPSAGYQSKLGHKSHVTCTHLEKPVQYTISQMERTYFTTYASRFATWGILFDLPDNTAPSASLPNKAKLPCLLSVTTLPPAIAERCKSDPKLLITLLRSTVWKYVEDGHVPDLTPMPSSSSSSSTMDPKTQWPRHLSTCPPGLIDMLNSRACRSAIMFNDELSVCAWSAEYGAAG